MIAIIPARGGSKGLPNKNIRKICGKPLIAWTINEAIKARQISKIIVSTDSKQIADIALNYGAEVPFLRPSYLAKDSSLAVDNYIYTLDRLKNEQALDINEFAVLQPTSPLRISDDIDNAVKMFLEKEADSVISYTEEVHPIFWHKKIRQDMSFEDIFDNQLLNRQDYTKTYFPNGAIFVFKTDLIQKKKYYSEKSYAYIMPRDRSIDIDTIEDFEYAEFLFCKQNKTNGY